MNNTCATFFRIAVLAGFVFLVSCSKFEKYNQAPELGSFQQGIRTSAAIGYCASIVISAHEGRPLPDNVTVSNTTGLIHVDIDQDHPLPFNKDAGNIIIASRWTGTGGIMSVLFTGVDILGGIDKLYGLWAVPLAERPEENNIRAFYADQDIILGYGSDTILDLSSITSALFNSRLRLLENENPTDAFVAVKQNFWIVTVDQNGTYSNMYDDDIRIDGGGQIAEVEGSAGGVLYHALAGAKINYSVCARNPVSGHALLQNFKAGGDPLIDIASSYISFHPGCDGKAHVEFCTGKYFTYTGKDIFLNLY